MKTVYSIAESGYVFYIADDGSNEPLLLVDDKVYHGLYSSKEVEELLIDGISIDVKKVLPLFDKVKARFPSERNSVYASKVEVETVNFESLLKKQFIPQGNRAER
jgi:hypothetical protein